MRKVLFVSYNYPPVGGVGRIRSTKLASYLPALGWSPTVLTVSKDRTKWGSSDTSEGDLPGVRVIRAPFPDILTAARNALVKHGLAGAPGVPEAAGPDGKAGSPREERGTGLAAWRAAGRWAAVPDRYALWIPFAVARGLGELRRGGYSLILSTSPPVSCHVAASILQRLSGLPWVADLRDPWAHPYLEPTPAQLRINHVLEKSTLSNSAALTTVSGPLARSLEGRHGPSPGGTVSIPNGFDPADYGHRVEVPDGRLVFTYTGSLFGLKRDPGAVLQVTEELIDEGRIAAEQVVFRFYGPREPRLREQRDRLKYPGIVSEEGVVSRGTAIRHQQESTALLVLFWDSPYATKGYGGKVLEYLGARRPILAWSPAGGIVGELLERTGAGAAVSNRDELRALLGEWFDEFRRTGGLAYRGKAPEVQRYSWKVLAGQFAALFESVAGG